jgi:Ca-activated chloride channel family protein
VDNEQELFSLIDKQLGDNRLFTVGIGSAPNSYFMRMAARAGRGTFTYIGDVNEVQQKISMLLAKLETPALVNIDIKMQGMDIEAYPDPVPDLYLGEPVTVLIRGKLTGNNITIFGDYGESTWEQTLVTSDQNPHSGVSRAWARNKIASLMEQHHGADTEQARDAIRNQIVQTSIAHRLVSRYTSLVAVDVTPVNSSGQLYSEKLKTDLPHGWKQGQNKHPANQQLLIAQLNLPQTATSASMHMMIASMLFALAMVFYLWRKML